MKGGTGSHHGHGTGDVQTQVTVVGQARGETTRPVRAPGFAWVHDGHGGPEDTPLLTDTVRSALTADVLSAVPRPRTHPVPTAYNRKEHKTYVLYSAQLTPKREMKRHRLTHQSETDAPGMVLWVSFYHSHPCERDKRGSDDPQRDDRRGPLPRGTVLERPESPCAIGASVRGDTGVPHTDRPPTRPTPK